jgi:hypothetical protein
MEDAKIEANGNRTARDGLAQLRAVT